MKRYSVANSNLERAKGLYDTAKAGNKLGVADKSTVKEAKYVYKAAKSAERDARKQLKYDKLADQGKRLYRRGSRMSSNKYINYAISAGLLGGSMLSASYGRTQHINGDLWNNALNKTQAKKAYGTRNLAYGASAVMLGGAVTSAVLTYNKNKKISAFYTHDSKSIDYGNKKVSEMLDNLGKKKLNTEIRINL